METVNKNDDRKECDRNETDKINVALHLIVPPILVIKQIEIGILPFSIKCHLFTLL